MRACGLEDQTIEATFVPADPPRRSQIGLWRASGPVEECAGDISDVDLFRFEGGTLSIEKVPMTLVPLIDAVEALMVAEPEQLSGSSAALRSAIHQALHLVARARLKPSLTPTGLDAWQLGPLDDDDVEQFDRIAAGFPPEAWAVKGSVSAKKSVDELATAVADAWVRSAGAPLAAGHRAFASDSTTVVDAQAAVRSFEMGADQRTPLAVLRVMPPPPGSEDAPFVAALGLQSRGPSPRVLDLESIWRAPVSLRRRFEDIEMSLLVTLRRAARVWDPIQRLLAQDRPDRMPLSDSEADDLLGSVGRDLGAIGLTVLVSGELVRRIDLTPVVRSAPTSNQTTRFDLSSVIELDWRGSIDGQQLSQEELDALAESKRSLVRFRGEWVRIDSSSVRRLREHRTIGASAALAAALGASVEVAGSSPILIEGPLAEMADRLRSVESEQELDEPDHLVGELRPYQRRGLAWLALMADLGLGGVLADDMGLGKTIQLIALHLLRHEERSDPTLVVCPASVVGNWEREINRFAPGVTVHRYHGQNRKLDLPATPDSGRSDGQIVLTTYGVARRDADSLAKTPWGLVVADEAQAIKNPYSRTARALRRIPAQARFALTGTPVQNHLSDLWAILDWSTPGLLGPLERFRRDLAAPVERGDDDAAQHLHRLLRPFLLRRTKADPSIVPDLPPKTETDEIVPLTTEQAALYKAVVREVMAEIAGAEGIERKGLVLRLITRLKQVCNHPEHLLSEGGPLAHRSGKLNAVTELLETISGEGNAALVFTQYVTMARLLERHFADHGLRTLFLHGGLPIAERERLVDRFQAGEADVFLLSLRAGGTGLNLTRATHVIHYDRWWNPAVEDQASDRAWRIGQDQPVQIHRMICEGTIEDRIATLLNDKRKLAEAVVGAGEGWISDLDDGELAELVALSDPDGIELEGDD